MIAIPCHSTPHLFSQLSSSVSEDVFSLEAGPVVLNDFQNDLHTISGLIFQQKALNSRLLSVITRYLYFLFCLYFLFLHTSLLQISTDQGSPGP